MIGEAKAKRQIGLLNCNRSEKANDVKGIAAERCKAPLTAYVFADRIPAAIQIFFQP